MTLVAARKALYLPIIAVLIALVAAAAFIWSDGDPLRLIQATLALAVVLLAPGFIARALLKNLLASRAHMSRGEFLEALAEARRFLSELAARPWIRHAIWAQYGFYTLNVGAMARNNAGAALIELGRLEEAEEELAAAQQLDASYPIPVFNRAVIALLREDHAGSEALARRAAHLGYAGGRIDRAIATVGETYARLATKPHERPA